MDPPCDWELLERMAKGPSEDAMFRAVILAASCLKAALKQKGHGPRLATGIKSAARTSKLLAGQALWDAVQLRNSLVYESIKPNSRAASRAVRAFRRAQETLLGPRRVPTDRSNLCARCEGFGRLRMQLEWVLLHGPEANETVLVDYLSRVDQQHPTCACAAASETSVEDVVRTARQVARGVVTVMARLIQQIRAEKEPTE